MSFEIKTDRLIIRELRTSDNGLVVELLNDPGFIENIGDRGVRSAEQAIKYIQESLIPAYTDPGHGMYLVELLDNTAIGMCGLLKREELEFPDIGFAFLETHCGLGYGYESAKAVLDHFRENWAFENILGITKQENLASRKLLQRLGLNFLKMINYKGDTSTCLYGLKPLEVII